MTKRKETRIEVPPKVAVTKEDIYLEAWRQQVARAKQLTGEDYKNLYSGKHQGNNKDQDKDHA